MSNTLNTAVVASDIIEALSEAKQINDDNKVNSAEARGRANKSTLRGYAIAAIAIRQLLDQELWTTGRQKKGIVSASQALKDALVTEAKAHEVPASKAKRLIEKAAAIVVPGSKTYIEAVHVASAQSQDEVLAALGTAGITKELDILNHVQPKVTDVVTRVMKAISKLEGADRKAFIREIVSHEVIDDILPEAAKSTAEERENARKAAAEAAKKPKKAVVNKGAAKKAAAEARATKKKNGEAASEEAMAVPKSRGSKKGAMTKAKQEEASDPFAA